MNKISFINEHWFWPVFAAVIILSGVFIWKEIAGLEKSRLSLKIILSVIAIGALALIALKPAMPTSETSGNIAMLTPGYEKSQLDSLKKIYRKLKILDYSSQNVMSQDIYGAEAVYILGNGLPEYELGRMNEIPAVYLPGRPPEGIIKVKYPDKVTIGDSLILHGHYRNPRSGSQIFFEGPGGSALDSLYLLEEEEQTFRLTTNLKATGNFVYYLTEKDPDGEIITRDPIPVQVEDKEILRILILNNFPTFETRYLKNYLAEAGHELVVRSQITRGRFKYEYLNINRTVIGSLSRKTLEPYDLLIIDAASLRSLPGAQNLAVENAVREDGLGVLIQPDEAFFVSPGTLADLSFGRERRIEIRFDEQAGSDVSVFPFSFKTDPGQESIYNERNTVVAGYKRKGQGRIGTTILSASWQLVLEGSNESYRKIWSRVIGRLSKRADLPAQFHPLTQFALPHDPYDFKITSEIKPVITNSNGRIIPLIQDVNFSEQWKGTIWPVDNGWHQLQHDTIAMFDYYIAEENSWRSLKAHTTQDNNRRYFDRHPERAGGHGALEPINPLWFYGLFLICIGGLWLEPKLT